MVLCFCAPSQVEILDLPSFLLLVTDLLAIEATGLRHTHCLSHCLELV